MHSLLLISSFTGLAIAQQAWQIGQQVKTSSGTLTGKANSWKPAVSEYLGVPFAQPATGALRFAAPARFNSTTPFAATLFSDGCPENTGGAASAQNKDTSEACLSLNVWTKPQSGAAKKAVLIWIYGGGFNSGRSTTAIYNGARLADEHDVVVVSVNYRSNIFGFPRAPMLNDQNLGLLDQRLGVEWVRDNIANFGGDPSRMVLFGQSAGGGSVDMYSFAYPQDPIVKGFIIESGTAANPKIPMTNSSAGWWMASQKAGCGGIEAGEATLACMRSKTWQQVLDGVERRGVSPNLGSGGFGPTSDPLGNPPIVFLDYAKRRREGNFAKLPILVGNTNYERAFYETLAANRGEKLPESFRPPKQDGCGSHDAAVSRKAAGVNAWRYVYAGQFGNVTTQGAGHGAEIALVFGTHENPPRRAVTTEESILSAALRKAWTDFAKDPVHGLHKLGWPSYDASKDTLIRLGGKNTAEIAYVSRTQYDECEPE